MQNEGNNNKTPTLPKVPRQDIWGRDLPLPNQQPDAGEEIAESIDNLAESNAKLFEEIVSDFQRYTEAIKASNQNFFLKQGKLLIAAFREGVLKGMVEGAEKTNDGEKLDYVNETLTRVSNNLSLLVDAQEKQNFISEQQRRDAEEAAAKEAQARAAAKEADRESRLKSTFVPHEKDKKKGLGIGAGLGGLLDNFAFVIPAVKLLLPLLAGLSLFFVDFEKLLKNPMWGKISALIQEKLIPGAIWLYDNVIGPLANFLFNTTLPAVVIGLINAFDDIVVFIQDIIDAFKADNWQDVLDKGIKALAKFLVNIGNTLLDLTLEGFGIDSEEWRKQLAKDWEATKKQWADFFGPTITGWFKSSLEFIEDTLDPEQQRQRALEARKKWKERWETFVGYWNTAVNKISEGWEYLKNIPTNFAQDWENTKKLWADRWSSLKGKVSSILNGISEKWAELTDNAYDSMGLAQDWEDTKEVWAGWTAKISTAFWGFIDKIKNSILSGLEDNELLKEWTDGEAWKAWGDKITESFWNLVDSIKDSITNALVSVKDYFVTLPGKLYDYVIGSVTSRLPTWLGGSGEEETSSNSLIPPLEPVRNIEREDAAKRNNEGGMFDKFLGGMPKFSGTTDAFRAAAALRDRKDSDMAPIIIQPSQVMQSSQTTYGGTTIINSPSVNNRRDVFGRGPGYYGPK